MERRIRMVLLDNLTPEDLLKLKHGGFFDGMATPMPTGVTGKEATLRVKEQPVVLGEKLDPSELSNTSETLAKKVVIQPQPQPSMVKAESAQESAPSVREEARASSAGPAPVSVPESAPTRNDTSLDIAAMTSFTKLRDVLQYVIEQGIPVAGVVEFCEQIKSEVPLLQRISNLPDRVTRTLEVMGHGQVE